MSTSRFSVQWPHNTQVLWPSTAIEGVKKKKNNNDKYIKIKKRGKNCSCLPSQANALCTQRFRQSNNFPNRSLWNNAVDIKLKYIPSNMVYITYHFRTFSMAARTFLMSSLALLRVSARPERPDILMLFWFIYRFLWNFKTKPHFPLRDNLAITITLII